MKRVIILTLLIAAAGMHTAQAGDDNAKAIMEAALKDGCSKFGADSAESVKRYSLYREFYKQKNYNDAISHWRYVFFNAPKLRETTHMNGAKMYQTTIKELPKEDRGPFLDTLFAIYDLRMHCFGEKGSVMARKAFDHYRFRSSEPVATLALFDKAVELSGNDIHSSYFQPWIKTAIKAHKKEAIEASSVMDRFEKIGEIADFNVEKGNEAEKYEQGLEDITKILFEEGYLVCDELLPFAEKKYQENPNDEKNLKKLYSQLKRSKCTSNVTFIGIAESLNKITPTASVSRFLGIKARENGDYNKAIEYFEMAASIEDGGNEKAKDYIDIAKMYRKLNQFTTARTYAQKATGVRPDWGEPYLLIGRLYASSGKLCGPGTGFESQVVTWPALDMFAKAKQVDPDVSEQAQTLINQYAGYMPTQDDCFFRGLEKGQAYTVGCWINASTTIRYK